MNPNNAQTVFDSATSILQGLNPDKFFNYPRIYSAKERRFIDIDIDSPYENIGNGSLNENLNKALAHAADNFGVTYTPLAIYGGRYKGSRKGRKGRKGKSRKSRKGTRKSRKGKSSR